LVQESNPDPELAGNLPNVGCFFRRALALMLTFALRIEAQRKYGYDALPARCMDVSVDDLEKSAHQHIEQWSGLCIGG